MKSGSINPSLSRTLKRYIPDPHETWSQELHSVESFNKFPDPLKEK